MSEGGVSVVGRGLVVKTYDPNTHTTRTSITYPVIPRKEVAAVFLDALCARLLLVTFFLPLLTLSLIFENTTQPNLDLTAIDFVRDRNKNLKAETNY